ncbi:DUF1911 domain-containing protein [Chitinibacter sp. SCUT-21]|uniref:DUF6630 family protein n=1 Tax=Chitinibacter sp. SCUT-21 TaxID=2970891 RepID=UPI0035A66384
MMAVEKMRIPDQQHAEYYSLRIESLFKEIQSDSQPGNEAWRYAEISEYCHNIAIRKYALGAPLADIFAFMDETAWPAFEAAQIGRIESGWPNPPYTAWGFTHAVRGMSVTFWLLLMICHDPQGWLPRYRMWVDTERTPNAFFDLMLKAFVPEHKMQHRYKANKEYDWLHVPLLKALAQAPERRSAAMAQALAGWARGIQRHRNSEWLPASPDNQIAHQIFLASEYALAACAYDLDDSSWRDHPYYPAELVDYYRAHQRHSRDAWRAQGAGAGVDDIAALLPPPPKRLDLAASKKTGVSRWLELACAGDKDAIAGIAAAGKPRKLKHTDALLDAMACECQAVRADLRDDSHLESALIALGQARLLPEWTPPAIAGQGGSRCEALVQAFEPWLAGHGYRLYALNVDGDQWQLVCVAEAFNDEFVALTGELGGKLALIAEAYSIMAGGAIKDSD